MNTQTRTSKQITGLYLDVRKDFPIFHHNPQLVYLDSAATTQKPQVIIDAETNFLESRYATVHRSFYDLALQATEMYEATREAVRKFMNAASSQEIIFTPSVTEALNLVAWIENQRIDEGDEIILCTSEHHSNILPWQRIAEKTGATLMWLELDESQEFPLEDLRNKISSRTKVVTAAHISHVLGFISPLQEIIQVAHSVGAHVVVDAAQSTSRLPLNVASLNADFVVCSGHKTYGPFGTAWLYGKYEHLEHASPLIVGGGTIQHVTRGSVEWNTVPLRFEAGTPNVSGVIALKETLTYLEHLTWASIINHEKYLVDYALRTLSSIPELRMFGPASSRNRSSIFSFNLTVQGHHIHSHDISSILNDHNIAIRGGHHCSLPLMQALHVTELARASCGIYSTSSDIDRLANALRATAELFS